MKTDKKVTVMIPTTCESKREDMLARAVSSLIDQTIGMPFILLVANGPRVDEKVLQRICAMPGVKASRLAEGNLPRALAFGRAHVATPYFGFLDDDDEYLPNALEVRLQALESDDHASAAITDGFELRDNVDHPRGVVPTDATADPLRALLTANWLASCGGLFRSAVITQDYFDGVTAYFEWTLIAFKIAATSPVLLLDTPTYRLHDSPQSLSKSEAYRFAEPEVLKKIIGVDLPEDVRSALRDRLGRSYHSLSSYCLRRDRLREAWRFHALSMFQPGGWRYASYTARLLTTQA